MKLVLFDIDGTLLWSDGTGRRAMEGALLEAFGSCGAPEYRYDGKTDKQIVRELMRAQGHGDDHIDARLAVVLADYVERLRTELAAGIKRPSLCAGVDAVLDALEQRSDVTLGLLTGNLEQGAALKLASVGIDVGRFRVNAFGSDDEHRGNLPAVAQERARAVLGHDVPGERIVIIGDTPADIACGRAIGARAVAVATGRYSTADLAGHDPAAVLEDLSDTESVVDTILSV